MFRRLHKKIFSPWGLTFLFLMVFASWTRLSALGATPTSLNWDEAALGYVGKMVVTTLRDEHNQLLPRAFRSFGDYKAPLAIYLTGLFTATLGLQAWVVRLPFALAGIASVAAMTWVSWRVFRNTWMALGCGWLLAVLPWHLLFSRVAFESGLSFFFWLLLIGAWLELRQTKNASWIWWAVGTLSSLLALYTYHSARIVVPLTLMALALTEWLVNRTWLRTQARRIGASTLALGVLCLPLLFTLLDNGAARAAQTTIFTQDLSPSVLLITLLRNFASHLSLPFLIQGATTTLRHGTNEHGVFLISHFAFFALGMTFIIGRTLESWLSQKKHTALLTLHRWVKAQFTTSETHAVPPIIWVVLLIIGFIPASLGFETPHANRALLAVGPAIIIMGFTLKEATRDLTEKAFALLVGMLLLFSLLEFSSFWAFYQGQYRGQSAKDWLFGHEQAVHTAWQAKLAGKRVKFTTAYGEPEIFFGFFQDLPAQTYRWERASGITFGKITTFDSENFDFIVAGENEELLGSTPSEVITRPDGTTAFFLYEH